MRLVDADELPIKYDGHTIGVWKNDLDNAPTVEAIPAEVYEQVKWERDVAVEQLKALNIEFGEKSYLKAIPIKWIQGWNHFIKSPDIKKMLEGWEKENGSN